jgi:hypothetical protein
MADQLKGRRRRVAKACGVSPQEATRAAEGLFAKAPAQVAAASAELADNLPDLGRAFGKIRETVHDLPDPEGEFRELLEHLSIRDALTPAVLQAEANEAEQYARRAHRLYVVANADYERFRRECDAVIDGMREAATRELQAEKDAKQRSKAITDADVSGRASVLFPDEWKRINDRRIKAEGMLAHLKRFAELWQSRCYGLPAMLNAGKRS